jgi:predicted transcriptional regulator
VNVLKQNTAPETVTVTARVPLDVADRLRAIAHANDRSVSGELRRVLKQHVDQSEVSAATAAP